MPESLRIIVGLYTELSSITSLLVNPTLLDIKKVLSQSKTKLISLMKNADIPLRDVYIDGKERVCFVKDANPNDESNEITINLNSESTGTRKLFNLLIEILSNDTNHNIYYANDLNAFLHPKLYKEIIRLFNSAGNKYSQLIFNFHDLINMNNENFRRDEIWFAYRNSNYETELVCLSNIVNYKGKKIRKDALYSKQYLEGKYGADLFIQAGLSWSNEHEE